MLSFSVWKNVMRSVLENEDVGRVDLRDLVEIPSQVSFKVQLCRDRYGITRGGLLLSNRVVS